MGKRKAKQIQSLGGLAAAKKRGHMAKIGRMGGKAERSQQ